MIRTPPPVHHRAPANVGRRQTEGANYSDDRQWDGPAVLLSPPANRMLGRGTKEHAMSQTFNAAVSVVGIDIGKNSFHIVGHDKRGATARPCIVPEANIQTGRIA